MTVKVMLSKNRKMVRIASGDWSETIPVSLLPDRLAMYRSLRDRKKGAYAEFYRPMVEALERASAAVASGPA